MLRLSVNVDFARTQGREESKPSATPIFYDVKYSQVRKNVPMPTIGSENLSARMSLTITESFTPESKVSVHAMFRPKMNFRKSFEPSQGGFTSGFLTIE